MDIIVGNLSVPIAVVSNGWLMVIYSCNNGLALCGRNLQIVENIVVKSAAY